MDVNFYWYYIGREDQSVNEKVMTSRLDQQIRVNKIMFEAYKDTKIQSKKLEKYMMSYLTIISAISSILAIRSGDPEKLAMKEELWSYMKESDQAVWKKIRYNIVGIVMNLPGKGGRKFASFCYTIVQKIYGFN